VTSDQPTWLDTARRIVDQHQHEHVDVTTGQPDPTVGPVLLDAFTASLMVQVHDALSPENAAKFAAMPLMKAHTITMKILEKQR
jgi:hypothetical protein